MRKISRIIERYQGESAGRKCACCWMRFVHFVSGVRMFIVRLVFIVYSVVAVGTVVWLNNKNNIYWLLLLTMIPLLGETVYVLRTAVQVGRRLGFELNSNGAINKVYGNKWFSPTVFVFLLTSCPSIWYMEVHLLDHRNLEVGHATHKIQQNFSTETFNFTTRGSVSLVTSFPEEFSPTNLSSTSSSFLESTSTTQSSELQLNAIDNEFNTTTESIFNASDSADITLLDNNTTLPENDAATDEELSSQSTLSNKEETIDSSTDMYSKYSLEGPEFTTESAPLEEKHTSEEKSGDWIFGSLSTPQAVRVMEQILLLTVIVGRWLLPKGDVTRDELSQLLLVNIGMAADIIELFETFGEEKVNKKRLLTIITLLVWQMSMLQFTLTKTATKGRKQRAGFASLDRQRHKDSVAVLAHLKPRNPKLSCCGGPCGCGGSCVCCETELWAIFTSLLLQDLPFFTLRMVLICYYNVNTYTIIFFTSKNALVLSLQLYRISVVIAENQGAKKQRRGTDSALGSLSHLAMDVAIAPGGPPLTSNLIDDKVYHHTMHNEKMTADTALLPNNNQHVLLRQTVPTKEVMLPPVLQRRAVVAADTSDEMVGCATSPVCRWLPRRKEQSLNAKNDGVGTGSGGYQVKPKLKLKRRSHGSTSVSNCSISYESENMSRHHSVIAMQSVKDLDGFGESV